MPFIGSLGGAYGYGRGQIATEKSVNAVYVTNISYSQTIIDASGNSWIVGSISTGSTTASIYNIKGQLVQTVTNNDSAVADGNIIGYASADGVTSVWITLIVGSFTGTTVGLTRLAIDSQKNLLLSVCLNPYAIASNQLFKVFNKNTTVNYTLDPCPPYHTFVLIKFNPNGNNSWVVTSTNSGGGAYSSMNLYDIKIDSTDAIITYLQVRTSTTNQNIQFRTSTNVLFGTNISLGASIICSIIVKYNSFGTSTLSWCGYILGSNAAGITDSSYPSTIGHECLQINSQNQIICTGRYRYSAVYGADGTQIGPNLLNLFDMNCTYIIRFDVNGTTSTSWRVVLGTSARQDTVPAALLVDSSDNIYCVGFCGARTNAYTFYAYNTSNAQVANMNFTANAMANIYIVKYSNAGTPLWVSSIRGTGTLSSGTTFNGSTYTDVNQTPTNTFCSLDVSGNIYIITTYRINSVSLYVGSTQIGSTLTTSISAGSTGDDLLIARILSDNTSGNITKICSITISTTGFLRPRPFLILNNDIYIAFKTDKTNLGFYSNGSNASPLTTLSNTSKKNVCVVCKYDNIFSSVNIAYLTSSTTTDLIMGINLINFDLSGNIIMTGTHARATSTPLLLQVYNFGSSTPDITRNVSTDVLSYTYIIKFTLDSTPPWIVRTASGSGANLYTTRIIENLLDITKNNKTYTCGTMTSSLYIYDKNNNLITNITSSGNGCFTLSLLNS
jgi:hypothetical protein